MGRLWCVLVGIAAGACTIKDVDYAGKSCPCAAGYTCDTATNTCHVGDASIGADSPPGETCYGTGPTTVCLRNPPTTDVLQPPTNMSVDTDVSPLCATVDGT